MSHTRLYAMTFWMRGGYRTFFDQMGPVVRQQQIIELCGTVTSWGRGDDEKRLRKNHLAQSITHHMARPALTNDAAGQNNCTIISLGCNGQWNFERLAFKHTPCAIHTFDCTGSWSVPLPLRSRVAIHRRCIGTPSLVARRPGTFTDYPGLLRLAGRQVPVFMKIDIEGMPPRSSTHALVSFPVFISCHFLLAGFEYNLMSEILRSAQDLGAELPGQLGIELHKGLKAAYFKSKSPTDAEFSMLMLEFRRHYELVERRENGRSGKAVEILLVKKQTVRGGMTQNVNSGESQHVRGW